MTEPMTQPMTQSNRRPALAARPARSRSALHAVAAFAAFAALAGLGLAAAAALAGTGGSGSAANEGTVAADSLGAMNAVAEAYVKLVLAVGEHDPDYVDAYYGPPAWRDEVKAAARPLAAIHAEALARIGELAALPEPAGEPERLRKRFLARQLAALASRVEMLTGRHFTFDDESQALYDAVAPTHGEAHFAAVLGEAREGAAGRVARRRPVPKAAR